MSDNPSSPQPSVFAGRRRFLQFGLAALAAAWAGAVVQMRLFPQSAPAAKPVEIPLSELPVGSSRPIAVAGVPGIVIRTNDSVRAFSLICTHQGCTINWQNDKKEFVCPCHDGHFDQFGEVVSGPPPAPLEQWVVTMQGERVIVGESA
jgi:cytochrome b6-f complex iron-sulfur subunit